VRGNAAGMGEVRSTYIFLSESHTERDHSVHRLIWDHNIKANLRSKM